VVVASRDKRVQLLALDALDRLYEYEGAKQEILAAARADLDAEEAAASEPERELGPESEAAMASEPKSEPADAAAEAAEAVPEAEAVASDEDIPPALETPVVAEETRA